MQRASRSRFMTAVLFALVCAAVLASSATAVTPPVGTPDLSLMVLQPSDFASATTISEGYQKPMGFVAVYGREFGPARTRAGAQFVDVYSEVDLETDALTASFESSLLGAELHSKSFHKQLAGQLAKSLGSALGVKVARKDVHFGRVRSLNVGEDSSLLTVTIRVRKHTLSFDLAFFRLDRALATLGVAGAPGTAIESAEMAGLAASMAADMKLGLSPTSASLPAIVGTPSPGMTLSVLPGTWLNEPASFTYQWERCDSTGSNCSAIAGQTGLTYTVTSADVGMTLRAAVVANNTVGSSKPTESVPTAVVH